MLTIVAYHVDKPPAPMASRYKNWGGQYERMLATLAVSARWADPHCRLVLCTDNDTPLDRKAPYEVFRRARDHRIALHRMETQAAFLRQQPPGRYVFVDTDILINKDPSDLFDFDVGVCMPTSIGSRLNSGVVYVKDADAGAEWFQIAAELLNELVDDQQVWMGDQLVQQWMTFGREMIRRQAEEEINWNGHRLKVLSSSYANWSPEPDDTPADGEHAYVWHFKGGRKPRTEEFYTYLEERSCRRTLSKALKPSELAEALS